MNFYDTFCHRVSWPYDKYYLGKLWWTNIQVRRGGTLVASYDVVSSIGLRGICRSYVFVYLTYVSHIYGMIYAWEPFNLWPFYQNMQLNLWPIYETHLTYALLYKTYALGLSHDLGRPHDLAMTHNLVMTHDICMTHYTMYHAYAQCWHLGLYKLS
jgi:hypothetical protein